MSDTSEAPAPAAAKTKHAVTMLGVERRVVSAALATADRLAREGREVAQTALAEVCESLKARGLTAPSEGSDVSVTKDDKGEISGLAWEA